MNRHLIACSNLSFFQHRYDLHAFTFTSSGTKIFVPDRSTNSQFSFKNCALISGNAEYYFSQTSVFTFDSDYDAQAFLDQLSKYVFQKRFDKTQILAYQYSNVFPLQKLFEFLYQDRISHMDFTIAYQIYQEMLVYQIIVSEYQIVSKIYNQLLEIFRLGSSNGLVGFY